MWLRSLGPPSNLATLDLGWDINVYFARKIKIEMLVPSHHLEGTVHLNLSFSTVGNEEYMYRNVNTWNAKFNYKITYGYTNIC